MIYVETVEESVTYVVILLSIDNYTQEEREESDIRRDRDSSC